MLATCSPTHEPPAAPTAPRATPADPPSSPSALVHPLETKPEANSANLYPGQLPKIRENPKKSEVTQYIDEYLERDAITPWHKLSPLEKRQSYDLPPLTQLELDFRHSFWHCDRMKTISAFQRVAASPSRLERFACCGSACRVQIATDNGDARIVANKCHDRFCKACGNERQRVISRQLIEHCKEKELRFVTLTLKHSTDPLADQINRLFKSFTNLRARKFWKSKVTGGVAFFEVKPDKPGETWHPHLHVIIEGGYIPQATLSTEWLAVTADSSIVHVEFVHNKARQLSYVAKYASKPLDGSLYHWPKMLDEAITALQGRRTCTTFGRWRGLQLDDTTDDDRTWTDIGSLDSIKAQADAGSVFHAELCRILKIDGGSPHTPPTDTS